MQRHESGGCVAPTVHSGPSKVQRLSWKCLDSGGDRPASGFTLRKRSLRVCCMSVSILLVEDTAELRDAVRTLLEKEGYVVHCAENPDEALDLLSRLPRPCILLWDAITPRQSLSMVDQAMLDGVHVASLPVSLASARTAGSTRRKMAKRLTSEEAILSIVREHCPLETTAIAQ
jgi:CheY-like chemotaxis protein